MINAINLIDGMDGLAGSVVILAGVSLFMMSIMEGESAGASFAYLFCWRYDWIFGTISIQHLSLGDTGSMSLGFVLSFNGHSFLSKKLYNFFHDCCHYGTWFAHF